MQPEADIGKRCREARELLGSSLSAVARELGCNTGTVWSWEAGKALPSLTNATALARLYGVRLDWLATGEGPRNR